MPLLDVDEATFDKLFAVTSSHLSLVLAVVPLMRSVERVILNIGSTAAFVRGPA